MPSTAPRMSADDLIRLPRGKALHELVNGHLRTSPLNTFDHGCITSHLLMHLRSFAKSHDLGCVVGPNTGYLLSRDPDTVRAPDISFVRKSRLPAHPTMKYFPGAPDLAVEVLSPSDTVDEIEEKLSDYFAAGTQTVWIVKPRTKTIDIWTAGKLSHSLAPTDLLTLPDLLPGFERRVSELFE